MFWTTIIGTVLGIVGTAVSVSMSIYSANQAAQQARAQGKAQENMAKYNAQVAENQATAANQNANAEMQAATEMTRRERDKNKRLRDTQLAQQAKTGGTMSGTALLIDQDQLAEMKLQELDIMHQGELRAREHRLQGISASSQATGDRFGGLIARKAGNFRAKTLLTEGYGQAIGEGFRGVGAAFSSMSAESNKKKG